MNKYYFLLTIIFFTNYIFANHPLLEMANEGPRWVKTTTVIDCRKIRKNAWIPDGMIGLGVSVTDIDKQLNVYYTGHHSERKNWNMFEYKIYEENDLAGKSSKYKLQDVYEDDETILFRKGKTDYEFNKKTLMMKEGESNTPRKCRYL